MSFAVNVQFQYKKIDCSSTYAGRTVGPMSKARIGSQRQKETEQRYQAINRTSSSTRWYFVASTW